MAVANHIEIGVERSRHVPLVLRAPAEKGGGVKPSDAFRVLVVEDEYFVALEIENWLTDVGHIVVDTASSADEAVVLAGAHRPDFVIMDIRLLGQRDGVDAAKEIFQRFGIRCLFSTAHVDPASQARAAPSQPLGWLAKPFLKDDFERAIGAAIQTLGSDGSVKG